MLIQIQEYISEDVTPLAEIFYLAVHNISTEIYTKIQLDAWAPESILKQKFTLNKTWICRIEEEIAGYIDFIPSSGYINHLYVHPDYQHKGIASLLYQTIETEACKLQIKKLTVDASKVALPFFLNKGFALERENIVVRRNVEIINFTLCKNSI